MTSDAGPPSRASLILRHLACGALLYYLRFSPIAWGKHRLMRMTWKHLWTRGYSGEVVLKGTSVKMSCDPRWFIQRVVYFCREYEPTECKVWTKRARSAYVIFDVGANVGLYTLLAASANSAADIHAFEPTPELVRALRRNIALNEFTHVTVNEAAVAAKSGVVYLNLCTGSDGANEGMNFVSDSWSDSALPTRAVSIDDYCDEAGISYIDLMKMDIEGGEFNALAGCRSLLSRRAIGCIVVELVGWCAERGGPGVSAICNLLRDHDYDLFEIRPHGLHLLTTGAVPRTTNVLAAPRECDGYRP